MVKKFFRIAWLSFTGGISAYFFCGAAYTAANYYLYFNPNKIAAEPASSMIFVAGYLFIGLLSGCVFLISWRSFAGWSCGRP